MLKLFGLMKAAFTEVFRKNNIFNDTEIISVLEWNITFQT